jgi:hypothetical protein
MTDEEIDAKLDQLARQQAIQTEALRAVLEGRWAGGADTVAGHLQALDPERQLETRRGSKSKS